MQEGTSAWLQRGLTALLRPLARLSGRRVPIVLQQEATECAAACLAMILGYHGRKTRLAECRERCGSGRDGATAQAIAEAARGYGLRARGYSIQSTDLSQVELPIVAFWNFNHFLVIEGTSARGVRVVDPAHGRQLLTAAEFDAGFTGVFLTFEPGSDFDRRAARPGFRWGDYLRHLFRTRRVRGLFLQILCASLLLQVLGLALPVFTKIVVDRILPFGLEGLLPMLGLGALIWIVAQALTTYVRSSLLIFVQARLDSQVMLGFFEHLLSLPYRFFQQRTSGDLLMRLSSNTVLRELLTNQTLSAIFDGTLVIGYLVALFLWAPAFAGIVLGIGALQVVLLLSITRRMHSLMQRELKTQAESQSYLVEALSGLATLKAAGVEDRSLEHWSSLFFKHLNVSLERNHLSALVEAGMTGLRLFSPLLLLLLGAHFVLAGSMSLGTMLALNALAAAFLSPLASLVTNARSLQLVGAHLERIRDVLEARPEQERAGARAAADLEGRLELENVSFRYEPSTPLVLDAVSLSVEPGQKVALVGPTGSGKSTIAKLLLGLYAPTQGRVLCDGRPLEDYDLRDLRSRFGCVLQETFLFSGTIRQNIAFHDRELTLERLRDAAEKAAVREEIEALPMGFETILSEGGTGLSGGQRQRLCIARALARKPSVLILDEATSHLDLATEARVDRNLSELSATRVVMAHRLQTIENADRIYVLEQGRVVQQGTHSELASQEGTYRRLLEYHRQDAGGST